jgi:hypothetical protein
MFLKRDYRDRAIGLVGGFAVLIAGALLTGQLAAKPVAESPVEAVHVDNTASTAAGTGSRCDTTC